MTTFERMMQDTKFKMDFEKGYSDFLVAEKKLEEKKHTSANSSKQTFNDITRSEAITIFKSFAGTLPEDFDAEKERDSYFAEKYGES